MSWASAPFEVKTLVLQQLDHGRDLLNAALTCSESHSVFSDDALWRGLIAKRFGATAVPGDEGESARNVYATLASLKVWGVHTTGAWLGTPQYWNTKQIDHALSPNNQVLSLNSVWWFENIATLRGVPAGTYLPYFRVAVTVPDDWSNLNLEHLIFLVDYCEQDDDVATKSLDYSSFNEIEALPRCAWTTLFLPQITIQPSAAFRTVVLKMTETSATLKQKFAIDVVGLKHVDVTDPTHIVTEGGFVRVEQHFEAPESGPRAWRGMQLMHRGVVTSNDL
ncbi:hypothetical protein BC830DRAFT_651354 [Chytriomyces sp. MP71]|nr:hypothetical protein BC830DRAFT_651354 [Chytriomyces sp. MP71]